MGKRRKKHLPKKSKRIIIASVSGIILVGVLLFGILFYTANVEVVGNNRYTDEEIKNMVMKGPLSFNTLLMSHFREHVDLQGISFMESVDVEYLNHNSIRLHVSEKYPIGYVEFEGYKYYFDKDGMVLEREAVPGEEETGGEDSLSAEEEGQQSISAQPVDGNETKQFHPSLADVPLITGLSFEQAAVGESLHVEDTSIFNSILGLDRMIEKYEIQPDSVEIGEGNQMTLHYKDVRVLLGKDEMLEEKMTRVAGILPKLSGESGELHLEEFTEGTQNIIFDKD